MREISFRGKRIDNGEWVFGITIIKNKLGTFISTEENPHYCDQYFYIELQMPYMVDSNTVGQYTGLTDKNGTKIFEGDIIKHGYFNKYCREKLTAKYIVKWGKCGFGISLACITEQDICEVIGTIHDATVEEVAE